MATEIVRDIPEVAECLYGMVIVVVRIIYEVAECLKAEVAKCL